MNAAGYLLERVAPERIAVVTETTEHRYDELLPLAGAAARALKDLGVARGDRVALVADNSLFWIATYLGTLAVGAVAVPLAPAMKAARLADLVRATGCRAVAVAERHRRRFVDAVPADAALLTEAVLGAPGAELSIENVADDDLAALMFTSGSTGAPRAVMVSHRNLVANTEGIVSYLGLDERERIMVVLPFHYCFGTSLLHSHLRAGGSVVLNNRFAFPHLVLDHIERAGCTGLAGVPSTWQLLLRSSNLRQRALPALRKLQQAGGKLPDVFIDELRAALPHARLFVMYGQTEATARLSYLPPDELDARRGSIGRGMPGVALSVVRPDGSEVAQGEIGEVIARGDSIARGYWEDPAETAQTFRDGALWTGDLARVDADGYVYIVDRAKDFIKASGHRVAAREIEDAVVALPEVVEAAAVGVPDDVFGEAVKVFVVLRRDAAVGTDDILRHCRGALAAYAVPREVVALQALPKSSSGKVDKIELRRR